jgi:hypothetical protein
MPSHKGRIAARRGGHLLAWITESDQERYLASFVGADAVADRAPATQLCSNRADAERWVENEAAAFGLPVAWMPEAPRA